MCLKSASVRREDLAVRYEHGQITEEIEHHKTFSEKKGLFMW